MLTISILLSAMGVASILLAGLLVHEALHANGAETPAGRLRQVVHRLTVMTVLDFDKDAVFGAAVPAVLFIVLPMAALVNAVQGGSPFLLICYIAIALSILAHVLLTERAWAAYVCAVLAGLAALSAFVVLPYFAVRSLTDHIVTGSPIEGAVAGTLIAVVLYAANAGLWTLLHTGQGAPNDAPAHRFIAGVLAAMPFGYVLYWYALLGVYIAGSDVTGFRGWGTLIAFTFGFAAGFALLKHILDAAGRRRFGKFVPVCISGVLGILAFSLVFTLQ
ncbi:MAG: hypothetical protein JJ900_06330 [Rhodospirillales bacterium]|nr:hypothetical protein [Rhodospirillales bacterium]MBO6786452.1 hypothetical protein [Rhodospirillales bacterium]